MALDATQMMVVLGTSARGTSRIFVVMLAGFLASMLPKNEREWLSFHPLYRVLFFFCRSYSLTLLYNIYYAELCFACLTAAFPPVLN